MKNQLKAQHHDEQDITIDERTLKQQLSKTSNWRVRDPDGIQGFWIKNSIALYTRIAAQLNDIVRFEEWMVTGRTVSCIKDESRGNVDDNYRPITCSPVLCKVLPEIARDEMY